MREVVLVTGASGGIGAAIAKRFAEEGYPVAIHYHQNKAAAEALLKVIEPIHGRVCIEQADLAVRESVDVMVGSVQAKLGPIGILINNAGIAQQKLLTDTSDEDWARMMNVNLTSVFYCTRAVLPGMISRRRGAIVNMSSIWGLTGASCEVAYSAAKAAVIGFTKALAKEVGPSGIRVNCVAPGVIQTPMNEVLGEETLDMLRDETPLGLLGKPEDVANAVFYLASEQAAFMTGQVLSPNGGLIT